MVGSALLARDATLPEMADNTPQLGAVDENGFVWTRPRQIFVSLYVATNGDAKTAARDAKLTEDPDDLLACESVINAIEQMQEQIMMRAFENRDSVLARLANWAESNVMDFLDIETVPTSDGPKVIGIKPKDLRVMPRHMQQRVKSLKVTYNARGDAQWALEVHDAPKANAELARLLGIDKADDGDMTAADLAEAIHAMLNDDSFEFEGKPEDG